jgi:haloalkane dehalogenase
VDEGAGLPVVLQHGNPTWCYLWRKVVRRLAGTSVRLIVPDLVGLGLSDKPRHAGVHTLTFHAEQIERLLRALELQRVIIVGQARNPDLVHGAVLANTGLAAPRRAGTLSWFHRLANTPLISDLVFRLLNFPIPIMHRVQGDRSTMGGAEKKAYRYPLRRIRDRTAPLALARMVPTGLDHPSIGPMREVEAWAGTFSGPVRLVWGRADPILGRGLKAMQRLFPNAPVVETEAGHFLQEEVPDALAEAILAVVSEVDSRRKAQTKEEDRS